ncbi:Adenylate cyclase type 3 [Homalodisca vitripennis]|nr:Adenylate cyclase type 3 [Homalodisca vitripennis]
MTSFFDQFQVVVQPHGTLNSSKGIVFSRELLECNLDEVKEELKPSFVTDVVRITRMEGTNQIATPGHILTFNLPHPPETIKAGYLVLSVRPYFRNPQRCFRCQKFGHSSKVCQNKELCVQCGKEDHNKNTCNIEPFCVNCKGKHSAASRNCKIYLEEKEVIKIATVNKLSLVDARKEYRRQTAQLPKKDVSYAKAAASTTRDTPSCSHCSSLEAMVEALTQQMANVISLLSANFNPIPQVQQKLLPAKTSDDPRLQSTREKFIKTPNEKTNDHQTLPHIPVFHPNQVLWRRTRLWMNKPYKPHTLPDQTFRPDRLAASMPSWTALHTPRPNIRS